LLLFSHRRLNFILSKCNQASRPGVTILSFIPRPRSDIATSRTLQRVTIHPPNTLVAMKTEGILQFLIPMILALPCSAQSDHFYGNDPETGSSSGYSQPERDGDLLLVSTDQYLSDYDETEDIPDYEVNGSVRIYAVVAGVGTYPTMPRLAYAACDAFRFYEHLTSTQGGAVPEENIRLLLNEDASRSGILSAVREIAEEADANDVIMFYFSGHGLAGAFLPADFNGTQNRIPHSMIAKIMERSQARHKICIADACFSGIQDDSYSLTAKGASASLDNFYDSFEYAEAGTAFFMSSTALEASWEDRELRHGVFTFFLIEGMSGLADYDGNGVVEMRELYRYVRKKVNRYTDGRQTPMLTGNYDGSMPISVGW